MISLQNFPDSYSQVNKCYGDIQLHVSMYYREDHKLWLMSIIMLLTIIGNDNYLYRRLLAPNISWIDLLVQIIVVSFTCTNNYWLHLSVPIITGFIY